MISKSAAESSVFTSDNLIHYLPYYKLRCIDISLSVIVQCLLVFVGSATVLSCMWSPYKAKCENDMLARVTYLYDPKACGVETASSRLLTIQFGNKTFGFTGLLPLKSEVETSVSSRLASDTRKYIITSVIIHSFWMVTAIGLIVFSRIRVITKRWKLIPIIFFYVSISFITFDISMGIVYLAHIRNCLTKGMVLRYCGWISGLHVADEDDWAVWLPIVSAVCWMRGVVILAWNIYSSSYIHKINKIIRRREVDSHINVDVNLPIPECKYYQPVNPNTLYYRRGESRPIVGGT